MFKKASNFDFRRKRRLTMVVARQVKIPFYSGIGRQRGKCFVQLEHAIERKLLPFLLIYVLSAAKHVGAGLIEFSAPKFAEVVSYRKHFKTAAKSVGRQTLRKQLVSSSRKRRGAIVEEELTYGRYARKVNHKSL